MTPILRKSAFISLASLCLTACLGGGGGGGGSSSSPGAGGGGGAGGGATATPVAASGFADGSNDFSDETFRPNSSNITVRRRVSGTLQERPANITMTFSNGGEDLTLLIDGIDYDLERNGATRYDEIRGFLVQSLFLEETSTNGSAILARASSNGMLWGEDMVFVYGFDSDPSVVDAQTGSTTYSGTVMVTGAQDGQATRRVDANITLDVDFNGNDISGDFSLPAMAGLTGPVDLELNQADITANGFSGTFTTGSDGLDPGQTLTEATYDGRFYGTDASAAGGALSATITETGEDPIFLQGGFLTNRD